MVRRARCAQAAASSRLWPDREPCRRGRLSVFRVAAPAVAPASVPRRTPIPHAEGVSDDEFRAAMSRLAAGVVLVTAHDPPTGRPAAARTSA